MIGTRYDDYKQFYDKIPFILYCNLERTASKASSKQNWHEDLEIQLCTGGTGSVLLDGKKYTFTEGDIAVANSNVIHYTGTDDWLLYSCLIIKADYCRQVGIDCSKTQFSPFIKSTSLTNKIKELSQVYSHKDLPWRTARLNELLLGIIIKLAQKHSTPKAVSSYSGKAFENVKSTIKYIRENYSRRLTLDEVSKAVLTDKYALCRDFKKVTGQTIIENLNSYRCLKAADLLKSGCSVTQAAEGCGFENLSFFSKTFKRFMGTLPSNYIRLSLKDESGN